MENSKIHNYPGQNFKVTYDKNKCVHAGVCVKKGPNVFNPKAKPWVNTLGATKDEIKEVISQCPSGALQFEE